MKKIMLIILIYFIFCPKVMANENQIEGTIYKESEIANIADSNSQIIEIIPNFSFENFIENIKNGNSLFEPKSIISSFLNLFANEIYININVMFIIIVLSIIWGIISNIRSSYNSKAISDTAFFAFYSVFLGMIINGLNQCMNLAKTVVSDQVVFMKAAVPVYSALIMSTGKVSTAVGMEPIFLYFIQLISSLMEKFVLPLVFWITILNIVNCITEKFSIKKLIDFVKQVIKWGLGILMTLFVGILGMSGFTASSVDGLGIKTLKFAVGNFVPIVGGLLSDSVNTVIASTTVLKNAMGTVGVIVIILMCAMPLIKMLALMLIYKLTAGIIEPLSDKRVTKMISEAGSAVTFIFLILLTVTIMFILGITIVISVNTKL